MNTVSPVMNSRRGRTRRPVARHEQQPGEHQDVGAHHPLQARDRQVEVALDGRDRDVDDVVVEISHEGGQADRHQCPPASGHGPSPPGKRSCMLILYCGHVRRSYTSYMPGVAMTCTAYSCQVMATTPAPGRTPADAPPAAAGPPGPPADTAPADTGPAETQRPRLSKAAVVERASALADAEGLDALTIRRAGPGAGGHPDGPVLALPEQGRATERAVGPVLERDRHQRGRGRGLARSAARPAGLSGPGAPATPARPSCW